MRLGMEFLAYGSMITGAAMRVYKKHSKNSIL